MPVIAIDPAPGKKSTIFDGRHFHCKDGLELRSYLRKCTPKTLLCWDAPLTGRPIPHVQESSPVTSPSG